MTSYPVHRHKRNDMLVKSEASEDFALSLALCYSNQHHISDTKLCQIHFSLP